MFYQYNDLAVAQIPKSGLRTIRAWLGRDFEVVENSEVTASTVVAFIRNPLERLKSCYSHMVFNGAGPADNWHDFIDYVLENNNEHWRPQSEHIAGVSAVIHRFEDISRHWETYKPGELPWKGRTSRLPTDDYRYDDLVEFYKYDQRLWDNAA